jgi:hypothetical protein
MLACINALRVVGAGIVLTGPTPRSRQFTAASLEGGLAGTMVCGGVGWLVTLFVTFANGWDTNSM